MSLTILRVFILGLGWPVLIIGSIYITLRAWDFYQSLRKSVFGKLVFPSLLGWLITMYSLGIVATFYMVNHIEGTLVVLPVFIVWFVTMVLLFLITLRWNKEAIGLQKFYDSLEEKVEQRTKELEIAHKKEMENEKQIEKLKDQFIFIAAHELRSPTNAIKWGLDSFFEEKDLLKTIPTDLLKILSDIYERNERMVELIENLLDVARIEEGIVKTKMEPVNINSVLGEAISENKTLAQKNSVVIDDFFDQDIPLVNTDNTLLKEVLTNLVTNAIKYNKYNGKVLFSWEQDSDNLIFHVKDTGIGIPEKNAKKIFNRFYQAENSGLSKTKGLGLGLYITKELITKMQGSIWIESQEGIGSTFSFSLPLYKI